jgi:hypothetical protein
MLYNLIVEVFNMSGSTFGGISVLLVLFAALGYFVYGGLNGAFAMVILSVLYGFAILLSFVPFIGIGLQYWVSVEMVLPWVISLTGIQPTWLTTIMLTIEMVGGFILWLMITLNIIMIIKEYIDDWCWRRKIAAAHHKSETPAEAGNNQ